MTHKMQLSLIPRDEGHSGAIFSEDRTHRYALWRNWQADGPVSICNWIMLNPSVANEDFNDPTIERCERRARMWGYSGLTVTNLFSLCSTDPRNMLRAAEPNHPENDLMIVKCAEQSAITICAWGRNGLHRGRATQVCALLGSTKLHALRVSAKTGMAEHPLYIKYSVKPQVFLPKSLTLT